MVVTPKMGCGLTKRWDRRLRLPVCLLLAAAPAGATTWMLTVAGLGGEPDYEQRFALLATDTDKILKAGGGTDRVVETFKGTDLAALLNRISATRQLVVDMTSSSGGATAALKKDGRTVITATKSGMEKNATVFARFWVEALRDPAADADKNEIVSALEAFHYAQTKTAAFYSDQKRLATEHPVLEDQAKAAAFPLVRYGSAAATITDPAKRELVTKKEDIENKIDALKFEKDLMAPEDYKKQIAALLLDLARTQEQIDK